MADVSRLNIGEAYYDLKDATARANIGTLESSLGSLAYKNSASGSYTPSGSVSAPTITTVLATENVNTIGSVGTLPTWSASVTDEVLSFSFNAGTLPTTSTKVVATGVTSTTASAPTFTGTSETITVS